MRRKRMMAGLAALSLLFSGFPAVPADAAELPAAIEQEADGEGLPAWDSAEDITEETDKSETDGPESGIPQTKEEETDTADGSVQEETDTEDEAPDEDAEESTQLYSDVPVDSDDKIAGSDGILYDGVAYLSAKNVMVMDEEMQEAYRFLCDDIAAGKEAGLEMQDAVLAVDAEGDLYCSYYMPMNALETIQAGFLPETEETLDPATEAEPETDTAPDDSKEMQEEEQTDGETTPSDDTETPDGGKDNADEEPADKEDSSGDADTADGDKEESEPPTDATDKEESSDGEDARDGETADKDESSGDADAADEETKDAESGADDEDTAEEETPEDEIPADDTEEITEDSEEETAAVYAENFDLIPTHEEVTFTLPAPARVGGTMDLGYGAVPSSGAPETGGIQLYSILPKDNYFQAQLTSVQKKYYKAAKERLIAESNHFSFQESLSVKEAVSVNVAHAVSALILEYPDRTDWMEKPSGFWSTVKYKKNAKKGTYTFYFDVSKFYMEKGADLEARTGQKVQEVGRQALSYAAENYPDAPVYGIVKYYDQWLCENGYYEDIGAKAAPAESEKEIYYNCHSAYGLLLNGYGVCESYSRSMARLLDAVGIPNLYAVGTAGGSGHTWNYIQMPDGNWYVQDSTWNDTSDKAHTTSDGTYLLKKDTGEHRATGCFYAGETPDFKFPELSASDYSYEQFGLDKSSCDLVAKETLQLTCSKNVTGYWTSSNTKVAKVDKKGKVTAVAGGTAVITFAGQGLTASCEVNVDQIKAVKTTDTKKTSDSVSLGIAETKKDSKDVLLTVDMGTSPHTAQWLVEQKKVSAPEVTNTKPEIASATASVADNDITIQIQAQSAGTTNVTVKFGGKTVKIKASVGQTITADMFEVTWPNNITGTDGNRTAAYTGKAIKPTIKKKTDDIYKLVKFKVTYLNNKNAGTAKAVITGTGTYGGTIEYPYTITPLDITNADFSKALKSKVYNGGSNPPATTVKLNGKALKVNRDYEILYTGEGYQKEALSYVPAGTYTVTIRGIGNYTGEVKTTQTYQVTQNTIAKISVSGAGSAKHTGTVQRPYTVKIGKNVLPASDYTITWYVGQGKAKRSTPMVTPPIAKGKYTAVITVKGNNLTTTAKKKEIVKKFTIK